MKIKILLSVLAISAAVSLIGAVTVFYVMVSQEKTAETALSPETSESATLEQNTADSEGTDNVDTKKSEESPEISIIATGDINIGRQVGVNLERQKNRYIYAFEKTADILKQGDVVFSNMEEPITASTKSLYDLKQKGKIVLRAKPEAINGIKYAGFNLLSLANNHILDYYDTGLFDTIQILKDNSISFAGAGRNLDEARSLAIIEKKGVKIGLLAYTDMADIVYPGNPRISFTAGTDKAGVAPNRLEYITEDINKARSSVDILIVSLHWGVEYAENPKPEQINAAHYILDHGADMIIGHHTHKFQGVEIYNGKPIFYSLGNLLFDQNDPQCQQGYIMQMKYVKNRLTSLEGIPYKIINKSQIVPQDKKGASEISAREIRICQTLGTKCHVENDKLVFELGNDN